MAIWHDIVGAKEADFAAWHTRQHMLERLGVPGFLVGRRYVNWSGDHQRWFTLYETVKLETLSSEDYRTRLNNPTNWSARNLPNFRNLARSACILSASTGRGIGGALATIRLTLKEGTLVDFEAVAEKLAHRMVALDGIVGAHFGVAAPATTKVRTRESELRAKTTEEVFDAVVMADSTGRQEMMAAMPEVHALLRQSLKIVSEQSAVYDLAYLLTAEDVV
jgi:hypothetical protein